MPSSDQNISKPSLAWIAPTPDELQRLLSGYDVTSKLGEGGMGAVYKGVQRSLERPVAIKILSGALEESEQGFTERFKNEARAMAKLNHPGIVSVYDFGQTASGLLFIVMEFVDGTDVQKTISNKGRLSTDHATAITAHVCDALAYAHERGIVHRDIKPANIIVGYDGAVKVADFGLARMNTDGHTLGMTQSGMAMGTAHYMAPEMMVLGSAAVDHRADVYAMGVMLYNMLTGKLPRGVFELPSHLVKGLDPRYDNIIARSMREDRERRYQSVRELRAELDNILTTPLPKASVEAEGKPEVARLPTAARPQRPTGQPYRPPQPAAPFQKQRSSLSGILFWGISIALLLGVFVWLVTRPQDEALPVATSPSIAKPSPAPPAREDGKPILDSTLPPAPIITAKPTPAPSTPVAKIVPAPAKPAVTVPRSQQTREIPIPSARAPVVVPALNFLASASASASTNEWTIPFVRATYRGNEHLLEPELYQRRKELFCIESDQTRGEVKLRVEEPKLATPGLAISSAILRVHSLDYPLAATRDTITVYLNGSEIGSLRGARADTQVSISLDPTKIPRDGHPFDLEMKCGNDGFIFDSNRGAQPPVLVITGTGLPMTGSGDLTSNIASRIKDYQQARVRRLGALCVAYYANLATKFEAASRGGNTSEAAQFDVALGHAISLQERMKATITTSSSVTPVVPQAAFPADTSRTLLDLHAGFCKDVLNTEKELVTGLYQMLGPAQSALEREHKTAAATELKAYRESVVAAFKAVFDMPIPGSTPAPQI